MLECKKATAHGNSTGAKAKSFCLNCRVADSNLSPRNLPSNAFSKVSCVKYPKWTNGCVRPTRISPKDNTWRFSLFIYSKNEFGRKNRKKKREEEHRWLKNSQLIHLQSQAWRTEILKSVCIQIRSRQVKKTSKLTQKVCFCNPGTHSYSVGDILLVDFRIMTASNKYAADPEGPLIPFPRAQPWAGIQTVQAQTQV